MTILAVPQSQDSGLTVHIKPCGPSKLRFPRNMDISPTHGGHVLQRRHHYICRTIINCFEHLGDAQSLKKKKKGFATLLCKSILRTFPLINGAQYFPKHWGCLCNSVGIQYQPLVDFSKSSKGLTYQCCGRWGSWPHPSENRRFGQKLLWPRRLFLDLFPIHPKDFVKPQSF